MDKNLHKKVMLEVIDRLNKTNKVFILKGGTSLYLCYGLDRFSTDIDLDSKNVSMKEIIEKYCKEKGYQYFLKKDTDTVQRYTIHYDKNDNEAILKIELSFRDSGKYNKVIDKNGIKVYDINTLMNMKLLAGLNRTKIRDLYDICFIYNNYEKELNDSNKQLVSNYVQLKGISYFDYLIKTQGDDEVIDKEKFEESFLKMVYSIEEKKEIQGEMTMYIYDKGEMVRLIKKDYIEKFFKEDESKGNRIWDILKKKLSVEGKKYKEATYRVKEDEKDCCIYGINMNVEYANELYAMNKKNKE